jgi:folate-dependent phosphoribosylglycinamide formyltransferase PurN
MLLVTEPLLEMYKNRIINVNPADLSIKNPDGTRKYTGDNAVYDAIKAGEKFTRSTVHIAVKEADMGQILVRSRPLEVVGLTDKILKNDELLRNFAKAHQDMQKKGCDWPAYRAAVRMVAEGEFALDSKNEVYSNGIYMPKGHLLR